jgi:hypothetical protein
MIFRKHDTKRDRAGRIRRAAVAAAVATALGAAFAPAAANAGTYQMYNCHVLGHETGTMGPWVYKHAYGDPNGYLTNGCAPPGGGWGYLFGQYTPGGLYPNSRADLVLDKDNSNITMGAMKLYFKAHADVNPAIGPGALTATVWKDGAKYVEWTGVQSPDYRSTPLDLNPSKSVTLSIACAAGGAVCAPNFAVSFEVAGVQTDLSESVKPGATISGGTLTTAGPHKATQTVVVDSTDPDSGVRKVEVLLDDKVLASKDYNRDWTRPLSEQPGACAFDSWNACALARTDTLPVNTKLLPDGDYTLTTRVTDAAGNVTTTQAAQPVAIDNVPNPIAPVAPDPIPGANGRDGANGANGNGGANGANGAAVVLTVNGTNGTANATVKAAFAGTKRGSINAAYGRKVLITGQLSAPNGQPISGARVSVLLQDKMVGAKPVSAGEVVTGKDGKFSYVATAQRSRTIRFAYRANLEDATFSQVTDISLNVLPKVALRTNKKSLRNGQTVRFSGSIAGAPANARKVVELQVKKGSRWMTFTSTRLRNGKFSEKYRFTAIRRRTVYSFRARVRQEAGFPFLTGVSKRVKVTVRG